MNLKVFVVLISLAFLVSCATVHEGSNEQKNEAASAAQIKASQDRKLHLQLWNERSQNADKLFAQTLRTDEVIIVGKAKVVVDSADMTAYNSVVFDKWVFTEGYFGEPIDSVGHFYIKFGTGKHELNATRFTSPMNETLKLAGTWVAFNLTTGGKIYYVGDVTVEWQAPKSQVGGMMFGLLGALATEAGAGFRATTTKIKIESESETIAFFKQRFNIRDSIQTAFLKIEPQQSDSTKK